MKIRYLSAIVLFATAVPAMAASTTINSSAVDITYDPDTFLFEVDDAYSGWQTLDNSIASISGVTNGVSINFNGSLYTSADGGRYFGYESFGGTFSLPLSFSTHAGQVIESYSITYSGSYHISNGSLGGGGVYVDGPGASFSASDGSYLDFSATGTIPGAVLPTIAGSFEAWADYTMIEIWGQEWVDTGYWVPGPCDEYGVCEPEQWVNDGYYEDVFSHYEGVIGDSSINLQSIQVVANIAAVPEASTYAMLLAGLGIVGFATTRRRQSRI